MTGSLSGSGASGGGATMVVSQLIIGNYVIFPGSDGLYVLVPQGFITKIELVDPRTVPVPMEPQETLDGPVAAGE